MTEQFDAETAAARDLDDLPPASPLPPGVKPPGSLIHPAFGMDIDYLWNGFDEDVETLFRELDTDHDGHWTLSDWVNMPMPYVLDRYPQRPRQWTSAAYRARIDDIFLRTGGRPFATDSDDSSQTCFTAIDLAMQAVVDVQERIALHQTSQVSREATRTGYYLHDGRSTKATRPGAGLRG